MSAGVIAVIILSVVLTLWYLGGHLYNRRRGQWLRQWVERGLEEVAKEWQGNWLGSPASGARILVPRAHPPFQRMELTLFLENREIPLLWLADRLQGKKDALVIKATCQSPRRDVIHAGLPGQVLVPPYLSWHQEKGPHGLVVASQDSGKPRRMESLVCWLDRYGPYLRRLILQDEEPHLIVWVNVSDLARRTSATVFFKDLQPLVL